MKQAPLRGLRCLPRDRIGTRSGRSAEALRMWTPAERRQCTSLHPFGGRRHVGGGVAVLGQALDGQLHFPRAPAAPRPGLSVTVFAGVDRATLPRSTSPQVVAARTVAA